MVPVIAACIFEPQKLINNTAISLHVNCVDGITANEELAASSSSSASLRP